MRLYPSMTVMIMQSRTIAEFDRLSICCFIPGVVGMVTSGRGAFAGRRMPRMDGKRCHGTTVR